MKQARIAEFDKQLMKLDLLKDGLESMQRMIPATKDTYSTHGIHPYVAKFMPQYPRLFIDVLSSPEEVVLDPMCGSGTKLIESALRNRNALGVDIDPFARSRAR